MFLLWRSQMCAAVPADAPVINSISASGTNLNFVATFPSGVATAALEMRPALTDDWQVAASLNVPAEGGTIGFTIPMPPLMSAFFQLYASTLVATNEPARAQISSELQFVAVPPLGPDSTNTHEAVFHFWGFIDGSDRIVLHRWGALWEHVNWGWPAGAVMVNGEQWIPVEKNFMTTTGAVEFLPGKYSLEDPRLELIAGRDVVALERTNDAVVVCLDDTPVGAAPYELKIHFPLKIKKVSSEKSSPAATLKISAVIDGSDLLKITTHAATWTHRAWDFPRAVSLNDVPWDPRQTNVLANTGSNRFLLRGVDLSTARIVERQGRDLATMWADDSAIWVNFADNPNGADAYELKISFGH